MKISRVIPAVVLALLLALFCVSFAAADDDPINVSMALSKNTFSEPEEITVSISISNVGESDLPGPVTLFYPSGKQVEEFGAPVLTVGTVKSWTGKWKVTQAELEAGRITFKVKYSLYNDDGELYNKTKGFTKTIIYTQAEPELSVTRTIRPTTAQKGQEVTVTYDIENVGTSDVTAVTIKENSGVSKKNGVIDSIPAGEKGSYTFQVTMGTKDITSSATVTCKAGGKTYTAEKVEAAVIKYGQVKLSATVSADKKGGAPGDTVKLTVKLKNSGTVDFTNVKVTDDKLGEVFSDVKVPAGQTVTLDKDVTITETQDVQFTVTAEEATGEGVETATGKVTIIATDPTSQIVLNVSAEADRFIVYQIPGNVHFTITVKNESAVDVEKISVQAVDTVINTFDVIPAGESRSFTRELAISMPGTFQFTASCRDVLGQTVTFTSNSIQIVRDDPTPVPTEAPLVTPPAPVYEDVPESYDEIPEDQKLPAWTDQAVSIADKAKWILAGCAGVLFLLILIGAISRGIKKSRSNRALDHLEGANYRDYSVEPKRKRRSEITGKDPAGMENSPEGQQEKTEQDSELMAETLQRLYRDDAPNGDAGSGDAGTGNAGNVDAGVESTAQDTAAVSAAAEGNSTEAQAEAGSGAAPAEAKTEKAEQPQHRRRNK